MKHRLLLFSFLAAPFLLILGTTSCVSVDESTGASAPGTGNSAGYDRGYGRGESDGIGGLSRTPERYPGDFSEADRVDYSAATRMAIARESALGPVPVAQRSRRNQRRTSRQLPTANP